MKSKSKATADPKKAKASGADSKKRLKRKAYDKELARLHGELVTLQDWVVQKGLTWALMYQKQSPWLGGEIKSLNLAATIAAEIARAVTIEMGVQITGSPRADWLTTQMAPVLKKIRTNTEYAAAKGGLMFKPYVRDDGIAIDYVQADQFYPVAFDANGNMMAGVFVDQRQIGTTYYTRLEYHELTADGYQITNTAFRSNARDSLGTKIALSEVADWAELEPEAVIVNIDRPLFAYFKMPFANNNDHTRPLGAFVYSRAVDLIKQVDEQWSNFLWEFESPGIWVRTVHRDRSLARAVL